MKNSTRTKRKPTAFFIAFLAVALVFLAIGLGTLGSFTSTGEDFELRAPVTGEGGEQQNSTVIFQLTGSATETYLDEEGQEKTRSVSLAIDDIYLYVSAIYSEPGTPATVSFRSKPTYSTSGYTGQVLASLENLYTDTQVDEQTAYETDALYRWIHPFASMPNRTLGTYSQWELTVTGANVRIAEVLFVGKPDTSATAHNQDRYIVSAKISSATPNAGETQNEANTRAAALLDAQPTTIPDDQPTSYDAFTKAEIYSLLTVTEMRAGNDFLTDAKGNVTEVYTIDGVNNVLGMDLVALGTEMFGVTPFGLRFMPMLFSFGILVLGFFFVKRLFKSDRAGFVFALLYALCDFSFSLGHVGTPLTAGLFFVLLAAYCVDSFYRRGIKKIGVLSLAPLCFGGLAAAAAICVNGAMLLPVVGIAGLFVAGMIRQQKANKLYLERAIERCEAQPLREDGTRDTSEVAKVMAQNRYKHLSAGFLFPVTLILGTVLFSLIFILPVYYPLLKFYDSNLAAPSMNMFSLGWKAFLGGFVGKNVIGSLGSEWNVFYRIFVGTGSSRALTAVVMNPVAALFAVFGVVYAVIEIVRIAKNFSTEGAKLRRIVPLLAGIVVSLLTALVGGSALGFIFLAYIFAFMLAGYAADECMKPEGNLGKAARIVATVGLVLLLVCFVLLAIFTFSVPVPAGFLGNLF